MKTLITLALLCCAVPVLAQTNIIGVLQTGDYTINVDTVEFLWSTLPPAKFEPEGFGGPPATADTFLFELMQPGFPRGVRFEYLRNGTRMPSDTISSLVPDQWYDLPGFDGPARIKFLPQPGIEEGRQLTANGRQLPTIIRNILFLPPSSVKREASSVLLDIAGRRVLFLHPGANDVSRLAPGVYFVRSTSAVIKVVID